MMRKILVLFICCIFVWPAYSLTGEEILKKVDANMTYDSAYIEAKMVINIRNQVREKELFSYSEGKDKSYAEFTSPPRDKGVKYLKIKDQMWMYLPSVEKVIKIAGHMLRQSMMGSDYSYEDALESGELIEKYDAALITEESLDDRETYVLELIAKVKEVTYYRRRIWVDKKTMVPLKENLYAKSGKLLKVMEIGQIRRFGRRYYPTKTVLRNMLRRDSKTEFVVLKAEFGVPIKDRVFTIPYLERK